jgi:NAD(P)-dependent dehydrogenase (short-subunit alcohol dehydrogenase family)
MDLGLNGKVALVTGGSKGIGEAIVRTLLSEGASVVNVNRSEAEGRALEKEFADAGQICRFVAGDVSDPAVCQHVVGETLTHLGRVDLLINNAGVNDSVGLDAGPDAFLDSIRRNVWHFYTLLHYCLPSLKQCRGAVVNIGSKVSVTGQGGTSGYAASKGAVNALTREWAAELASVGVRVNTVIPAEVWTPLYAKWIQTLPDPESARSAIERLIPLEGRFTTAEEIADMVVFLASPRSSHTTGQIIFVDGGYTHLDRKLTGGPPSA